MPSELVSTLQRWFDSLSDAEKREVVDYVYGKSLRKGLYLGPIPARAQDGLHVGPTPRASAATCPTCGRTY